MASKVGICNMALTNIGAQRIEALTDRVKGAELCSLYYDTVRDAVLRAFPWNFAKKQEVLALTDVELSGWDYVYAYPSDCIFAREIYGTSATGERVKFEVVTNTALNRRQIATDQEAAELIYTARVEDPNVYDPIFVAALSYALAVELCVPMKGNPELKSMLMREYQKHLGDGEEGNANEVQEVQVGSSIYLTARN